MIGQLEDLRERLGAKAAEAEKGKDDAALKEIDAALVNVDRARADLAANMLAEAAGPLSDLKAKVDAATKRALAWPLGGDASAGK